MKRIGLIGGLGPEATIEYYNGLINAYKDGSGDLILCRSSGTKHHEYSYQENSELLFRH